MSIPKSDAVDQKYRNSIELFERDFKKFASDVAKLSKALRDAKNSKSVWSMKSLKQVNRALKAYSQHEKVPNVQGFAEELRSIENDFQALFHSEFGKGLRETATQAKLDFRPQDDFYVVGPFEVVPHLNKDSVSLRYAKALVMDAIALNPKEVVGAILSVTKDLLEAKHNVHQLADDFEVAVRVCVARNGLVKHGTLRAELPQLLEEMEIIRARSEKSGNFAYGRPRFVVELATLVKSNENIEGKLGKEFRLETAVIDNSRNDAKSVFVPDRLQSGSGEGKYYQAINMIHE